jgi:UDP-N-acetylglucosamine--N-acetylmuramyl-(pentapeptide) pyrophosphoryl-undecaprenol N-acetylglucosamine transferase
MMRVTIAAGGTGGHIFPALAVAQEFRRRVPGVSLLWIGTSRNRERELCERNDIPLRVLDVKGLKREVSTGAVTALFSFAHEVGGMRAYFKKNPPHAVVAFGGYVSAPVLAAARMRSVPYFLQEQNTVPGLVNRLFARNAVCTFLGFPLAEKRRLRGVTKVTGTPIRRVSGTYADFPYPSGFDKSKKCVLISGGSQGAESMNRHLLEPVKRILEHDIQVVWQTGVPAFREVSAALSAYANAFVFDTIEDLYPYYAAARVVICRAGASTLNEVAYFGLPCVMMPLPWASENHQWINAGLVEGQGRGVRIAQEDGCGDAAVDVVLYMLSDQRSFERMCQMALDHSPVNAAAEIVTCIVERTRTC